MASSFRLLPSWNETKAAIPGLFVVVFPIAVISELIYWLESDYVEATYHIPAPVIALMIAAVIAIVITNIVNLPAVFNEGVQFSTRWLLKIGIVLYGLNFSYDLWLKPGSQWILLIGLIAVAVPIVTAYSLGKLFRLDDHSSMLVGVGTGVCGISAIVATHQALKSEEESAGMALATILVFGTFILFLYPILEGLLSLSTNVYGVWTGATTLDLPQLVAASLQGGGNAALLPALWVKSIRIGLLAPVILVLVTRFARSSHSTIEGN
ncbi:MAG: putative sulfate exporter family transporter, partial [Nitrososphaerota archaeon]|nr:putative sulfate exporter family transporter [Nitrososphaerota archaeon]